MSSRDRGPVRGTDAGRHASGTAHDHRSALAEPDGDDFFESGAYDAYDDHHDFLLDGDDRHADTPSDHHADQPDHRLSPGRRPTRAAVRDASRRRRRRRTLLIAAIVLVSVVGVSAWLVGVPIYRYFHPADYSGAGTGSVVVTVHANDGASQIGTTLQKAGVVASQQAFVDQAKKNSRSQNLQPGSYTLHRHMSAADALALMLSPTSRLNSDVVVTEGATVVDVARRLTAKPCAAGASAGTVCGLGLSSTAVTKALSNVTALGLPTDFTVGGKLPGSVEGFLFPATYPFDHSTGVEGALQQMVSEFTDNARSTNFTAQAKALGLTPYQELIIASIAQGEAKFPQDMPKVARVILNRIKAGMNLQIDATSAYAAKLKGLDPTKTIYSQAQGPYNTYNHAGLPPTPIGNPGTAAMQGAAHPATGNWLYYVNGDAAGHLFFTNSQAAFAKAAAKCKARGWGCG